MKMENKLETAKRKLEEIGSFSCPQNPDSSLSKVDFSILFYSNLYQLCLVRESNQISSQD